MKKLTLALSILLMMFLGFGCKKTAQTTDSGLTSITVDSGTLSKAIKEKVEKNADYKGLKIVGVELAMHGYTPGENKELKFQCFDPPQKGDDKKNSSDCSMPSGSTMTPPSGPPPSTPEGEAHGKNPPQEPPQGLPTPPPNIKPGEKPPVVGEQSDLGLKQVEITDQSGSKELSKMSLKYNSGLEYYGYLIFYCTTDKVTKPTICIQNKEALGSGNKATYANKKLSLPITLQWTQSFGGSAANDSQMFANGEGQVGQDAVDVEVAPTLED